MKPDINSLGIKVKEGDNLALEKLLDELKGNIAAVSWEFYSKYKRVLKNEDFDDIFVMLQFEVSEACKEYEQELGNLIPRVYEFWNQRKAKLLNHYRRQKRDDKQFDFESVFHTEDEHIIDDTNWLEPVLDTVFAREICKEERHLIALNGIMEGNTLREIARDNPSVFRYHQDVKKALEEVYKAYKAG